MKRLGYRASVPHPPVVHHSVKKVVHVDDFVCVGPLAALKALCAELNQIYDMKSMLFWGVWEERYPVSEPGAASDRGQTQSMGIICETSAGLR